METIEDYAMRHLRGWTEADATAQAALDFAHDLQDNFECQYKTIIEIMLYDAFKAFTDTFNKPSLRRYAESDRIKDAYIAVFKQELIDWINFANREAFDNEESDANRGFGGHL